MQQYFVENEMNKDEIIFLDKEASHHVTKVMRNRVGQHVRLIHKKKAYLGEIEGIDNNNVSVKIIAQLDETRELQTNVTIALGLLKGDKLEYAIQKCTELGMKAFIPWQSDYAISKVTDKKIDSKTKRWQTIAQEASEQSQRHAIPKVYPPLKTKELMQVFSKYDFVFIAYEGLALVQTKKFTQEILGKNILVIVGPEGGISDKELTLFKEEGAQAIGLGSRILRAETATMFMMSLIGGLEEML